MRKLFVGNLSWNVTDESLRKAFERFGEVADARVVKDRDTGRSRGFGFVTFAVNENADQAISEMDGASLDGRNIKVSEAQDRPRVGGGERGGERGGRRGGDGGRREDW